MEDTDRMAIEHMVEAARLILTWAKGGKPRFLADRMRQSAVERQFEILGGATERVSEGTRDRHPDIPWRSMAGMRDLIIHADDAILPETVWEALAGPLREAVPQLERILEESGRG